MTREQAQEILLLHRPGMSVESDLQIAEALRMLANDPELARWFDQQREFNALAKKQFAAIEPPAGLKEKILVAAEKPVSRQTPLQRHPVWTMAAAVVILMAAVSFWFSRRGEDAQTFANFHSRMSSFALRTYGMDIVTNNPAAVREYLSKSGAPADFALTPALEKLPVKGGGRLSWQNQPVAMMCFGLTNNQTAFMFVIAERAVKKRGPEPAVSSDQNFSSVTWSKDGKVYLLAAAERPEVLRTLAGQ